MFTEARASIFCRLTETIILYEAMKNRRQQTPDDKNIVRRYDVLRSNVKYWFSQLLDDGF